MASRKSIRTSNSNSAPRYTLFLWSSICIPNFFVHGSVICDLCTKKLGMQIEPHAYLYCISNHSVAIALILDHQLYNYTHHISHIFPLNCIDNPMIGALIKKDQTKYVTDR